MINNWEKTMTLKPNSTTNNISRTIITKIDSANKIQRIDPLTGETYREQRLRFQRENVELKKRVAKLKATLFEKDKAIKTLTALCGPRYLEID